MGGENGVPGRGGGQSGVVYWRMFIHKGVQGARGGDFQTVRMGAPRKLWPESHRNAQGSSTKVFVLPWLTERQSKMGVVISQTHWLVSQERLSPRAGTSVFIEYTVVPSGKR